MSEAAGTYLNNEAGIPKKPELLAPGGDLSKALTALKFGADAVYIGGTAFGLRAAAGNFSDADIDALLAFAHPLGRKVYVTLNILPRTCELEPMAEYARKLYEKGIDGVIVADIGAMLAIRRAVPSLPVHVSTQANTLNAETCRFWASLGAVRVNLARELSLSEIEEISSALRDGPDVPTDNVTPPLELEVFVHGAMCMAFSGRCMLSDYLTGRSSNRGECAQPCRWNYSLLERGTETGFSTAEHAPGVGFSTVERGTETRSGSVERGVERGTETRSGSGSDPYILSAGITEEKRPGQVFGVEETERGTFLFNSKDLCLLPYLPELIRAGASALKIEGRMKSEYYVAVTVRAYRIAIDLVYGRMLAGDCDCSSGLTPDELRDLMDEVSSVSHREYSDGFFCGGRGSQVYGTSSYIRNSVYAGIVEKCDKNHAAPGGNSWHLTVSQRGNFGVGEVLEFIQPDGPVTSFMLNTMTDSEGQHIVRAPHPCMTVHFDIPFPVAPGSLIRVRK